MISGEEYTPRVIRQQEYFETNRPLQGIDEVLVLIFKRHHAAASIAFNIHDDGFFWAAMPCISKLTHVIARGGNSLAEENLTDICRNMFVFVDGLSNGRSARREFAITLSAVAMELDMRQMHGKAFGGAHGLKCGFHIARHAKIIGVYM